MTIIRLINYNGFEHSRDSNPDVICKQNNTLFIQMVITNYSAQGVRMHTIDNIFLKVRGFNLKKTAPFSFCLCHLCIILKRQNTLFYQHRICFVISVFKKSKIRVMFQETYLQCHNIWNVMIRIMDAQICKAIFRMKLSLR